MAKLYRRDVRRLVKKNVVDITGDALFRAYRQSWLNGLNPILLDSRYRALPTDVWETVLAYSQINAKQYRSENYDCDNFALALAGQVPTLFDVNGVGVVIDYSGSHAYNALIVCENDAISIVGVEPQNDRWGVVESGGRMYSATNGYILFG